MSEGDPIIPDPAFALPASMMPKFRMQDLINEVLRRGFHVCTPELMEKAKAALEATTWQPIETIPDEIKDSMKIVLLWNGEVVQRGWFDNICGKRWSMENLGLQTPLMWMPLPEPPK